MAGAPKVQLPSHPLGSLCPALGIASSAHLLTCKVDVFCPVLQMKPLDSEKSRTCPRSVCLCLSPFFKTVLTPCEKL